MPDITLNPRSPQSRRYYWKVFLPRFVEIFGIRGRTPREEREIANKLFKAWMNESRSYEYTPSDKFWKDIEEARHEILHLYGEQIDMPNEIPLEDE